MSGLRRFASDNHRRQDPGYWNQRSFRQSIATPVRRIATGLLILLLIVFFGSPRIRDSGMELARRTVHGRHYDLRRWLR